MTKEIERQQYSIFNTAKVFNRREKSLSGRTKWQVNEDTQNIMGKMESCKATADGKPKKD